MRRALAAAAAAAAGLAGIAVLRESRWLSLPSPSAASHDALADAPQLSPIPIAHPVNSNNSTTTTTNSPSLVQFLNHSSSKLILCDPYTKHLNLSAEEVASTSRLEDLFGLPTTSSQGHLGARLISSEIAAGSKSPMEARTVKLLIAIGHRLAKQPLLVGTCPRHLARVSLFNEETVIIPKIEYLETLNSDDFAFAVLATANISCHHQEQKLSVFVQVAHLNWGFASSLKLRKQLVRQNGCPTWPPLEIGESAGGGNWPGNTKWYRQIGQGRFNLINASIVLPACSSSFAPPLIQKWPLCRPEQLGPGTWKARREMVVDSRVGMLARPAVALWKTVWEAVVALDYIPNNCRLHSFNDSTDVAQALHGLTLLFVGDSTMVELTMLVVEMMRHYGFARSVNDAELQKIIGEDKRFRIFDSGNRLSNFTTVRMLWGPGKQVGGHELSVLHVVKDAFWQERFSNLSIPAPGTQRTVVVFNAGLHDIEHSTLELHDAGEYAQGLRAFAELCKTESRTCLFWLTSPVSRSFGCPIGAGQGMRLTNQWGANPEVDIVNRIMRKEAARAGIPVVDAHWMRLASPFEGDGHHCVGSYDAPVPYLGRRRFGSTCAWRVFLLLHVVKEVVKDG